MTVTHQRMDLGTNAAAWEALRDRSRGLAHWTDRAVQLANEAAAEPPQPTKAAGARLRLIPPVAALGTAWVLQVIAMTDIVGGRVAQVLADSPHQALAGHAGYGYLAGLLLGIAVASGWEGGAAYLMDLYDKHLLARDSVGLLRIAMVAYVAVSAAVLHWWLESRALPSLVAWVLAALSGSALFLWSRGSRWKHRDAMRSAGQLDPALPKLPAAAKIFHPVRWLVTLYLISWTPAGSPEEARRRYADWRDARRTPVAKPVEAPAPVPAPASGPESAPDEPADDTDSGAPGDDETAAQRARQDSRTAQEIEDAVRAIAAARPDLSRNKIAKRANTSPTNVRRILGPATAAELARSNEPESAPETAPESALNGARA